MTLLKLVHQNGDLASLVGESLGACGVVMLISGQPDKPGIEMLGSHRDGHNDSEVVAKWQDEIGKIMHEHIPRILDAYPLPAELKPEPEPEKVS